MIDMKRIIPLAVASVVAVVLVPVGFVSASSLMTAEPVPTCTAPTGTMTVAKHYAFDKCMHERTQALVRNGYEPAPTVTETVTVPGPTTTVTVSPSPSPTATSSPTPTDPPTTTPPPTGVPKAADYPTRESVGPAVDPTVVYSGDCTFDASESNVVVENRILNCMSTGIRITNDARGVTFRNSILRGGIFVIDTTMGDPSADTFPRQPSVIVEDSDIIQTTPSANDRAACCGHFTIRRSYIQASHSGLAGHNNVVVEGNYITTDGTDTHQSGLRVLKNSVVRNNTITCKPVGAGYDASGCSAHGVFYREALGGQGVPAFNLTIDHNYFKRDPLGGPYVALRFIDCAAHNDCLDVDVTNNLFSLGEGTDSGEWPNYGGNVWAGNYWTDGTGAESGESR